MVILMVTGGKLMPRRGENIRKRKDGRWEGRVRLSLEPYPKYKSLYGKTYGEVKAKIKDFVLPDVHSKITENKPIPFYAELWLEKVKEKCKYSTYVKYRYLYCKHIEQDIKDISVNELSKETCELHLINVFNQKGRYLSLSTMKSIKYVFNQIIHTANCDWTVDLPDKIIKESKFTNREIKIFSSEEQTKLVDFLLLNTDKYKIGILICLSTGIRLGELCALKTEQIDVDKKTIQVTQTVQRIKMPDDKKISKTSLVCTVPKSIHSLRTIPIPDKIAELIKNIDISGTYFIGHNLPFEPRTYQYKFKSYLMQIGIETKNFHSLRHTFATNCIDKGMDIKCLSEILGHSDVKTTLNRYVHPSLDQKRVQMNKCSIIPGQK